MARDSYPFPLHAVDADIERVGGKGAYLGMLREGTDGKEYVLAKLSGTSLSAGTPKQILSLNGGTEFECEIAADGGRCSGVSGTDLAVISGQHFWLQIGGVCNTVLSTGTKGSFIGASSGGIGATIVVETDITAATLYRGYLGWGINDAATVQKVWIRPGFMTQ